MVVFGLFGLNKKSITHNMCAPLMTLLLYCYIYDIFAVRGGVKLDILFIIL